MNPYLTFEEWLKKEEIEIPNHDQKELIRQLRKIWDYQQTIIDKLDEMVDQYWCDVQERD